MNTQKKFKILVVDDDANIRDAICDYLVQHGFLVEDAEDVAGMEAQLKTGEWNLVILDVMMPGEDGVSACRRLYRTSPPILMLSALGETIDRVVGLESGASDYLAKPFEPRELLAKVRALLRLVERGEDDVISNADTLTFEGWSLNQQERNLHSPSGEPVPLTSGDYDLLLAFLRSPRRLLTRETLIDIARGRDAMPYDRAIDLAVSRLRSKLKEGGSPNLIETVRGAGYRFNATVSKQ